MQAVVLLKGMQTAKNVFSGLGGSWGNTEALIGIPRISKDVKLPVTTLWFNPWPTSLPTGVCCPGAVGRGRKVLRFGVASLSPKHSNLSQHSLLRPQADAQHFRVTEHAALVAANQVGDPPGDQAAAPETRSPPELEQLGVPSSHTLGGLTTRGAAGLQCRGSRLRDETIGMGKKETFPAWEE